MERWLVRFIPIGIWAAFAACTGQIEELAPPPGAVGTGAGGEAVVGGGAGVGGAATGGSTTGGADGAGCTSAEGGGGVAGGVPTSPPGLLQYLEEGAYRSFTGYSEVIRSSDHGNVRIFLNPILEASLAAGSEVHPEGAAAIRENYDSAGTLLVGWSASIKTQADSAEGQGWYWYEINTMVATEPSHACHGVGYCLSCHRSAPHDLVQSSLPLP